MYDYSLLNSYNFGYVSPDGFRLFSNDIEDLENEISYMHDIEGLNFVSRGHGLFYTIDGEITGEVVTWHERVGEGEDEYEPMWECVDLGYEKTIPGKDG